MEVHRSSTLRSDSQTFGHWDLLTLRRSTNRTSSLLNQVVATTEVYKSLLVNLNKVRGNLPAWFLLLTLPSVCMKLRYFPSWKIVSLDRFLKDPIQLSTIRRISTSQVRLRTYKVDSPYSSSVNDETLVQWKKGIPMKVQVLRYYFQCLCLYKFIWIPIVLIHFTSVLFYPSSSPTPIDMCHILLQV